MSGDRVNVKDSCKGIHVKHSVIRQRHQTPIPSQQMILINHDNIVERCKIPDLHQILALTIIRISIHEFIQQQFLPNPPALPAPPPTGTDDAPPACC
jgi:hypothetical protein